MVHQLLWDLAEQKEFRKGLEALGYNLHRTVSNGVCACAYVLWMCVHMCVHACIYISLCSCVCTHMCIHIGVRTSVCSHMQSCVCTCLVCSHVCLCMCVHASVCVCGQVHFGKQDFTTFTDSQRKRELNVSVSPCLSPLKCHCSI